MSSSDSSGRASQHSRCHGVLISGSRTAGQIILELMAGLSSRLTMGNHFLLCRYEPGFMLMQRTWAIWETQRGDLVAERKEELRWIQLRKVVNKDNLESAILKEAGWSSPVLTWARGPSPALSQWDQSGCGCYSQKASWVKSGLPGETGCCYPLWGIIHLSTGKQHPPARCPPTSQTLLHKKKNPKNVF